MISSRKLMRMARKWIKLAVDSRKRLTFSKTRRVVETEDFSIPSVVKSHVTMYSADQRRFSIPLAYLDNDLFRELLRMAEAEYGLSSHGPITLPCDSIFMEYAVSLIRRHAAQDLMQSLMNISTSRCSSSCFNYGDNNQQLLLRSH